MSDEEDLGEQIVTMLEQERDRRRAHPDVFLAEIAKDLWMYMEDDEALEDFKSRLEVVAWWATDVVECLERVVREQPSWAATTLVEASGRGDWLGPDPGADPEPYLRWLARQAEGMRAALDRANDEGRKHR